ncbi:MAG: carbamoyltransferase HypF [Gammaproteobacteria bacterium]|nr:carbamoyltransferase HypF [Gammaproteobacteria bacterium]
MPTPQNHSINISRFRLHISGAVQGVGFRPFVYKLAQALNLTGWVRNDIRGLYIEIEGSTQDLTVFQQRLQTEAPPIAEIKQIQQFTLTPLGERQFEIVASDTLPDQQPKPSVLPDLASCPECLQEIQDSANRRFRYPFTSCTLCGPRWSIIEALPYDRPNTTMTGFPFCPACEKEYTNPANRRFHHQVNTCPVCGPQLTLWDRSGATLAAREAALQQVVLALKQGKIIALKGIGGFQLLVDAHNEEAVTELRRRKQRPAKPFALMCSDLQQIRQFCCVNSAEQILLQSIAAPIVLLKKKTVDLLAPSIAPGNPYLGIMLPYSVLHHLLLQDFGSALICTSGNVSGDPICKDNNEALHRLHNIADLFLVHDRPVARALDDSVAQVVLDKPVLLRRARGYAPRPIDVKTKMPSPAVLAVGAHIKNTIALALPGEEHVSEIMLSAHLGDLDAPDTRDAFLNRIEKYKELYRLKPALIVHDLHPDYHSTQYAINTDTKKFAVQHHWAHVAACMAEHQLDQRVLAVTWDGVGLGDDGTAWGGEFMLADLQGYKRLGFLLPFPLPGGDQAARDSRRSLLGALHVVSHGDQELARQLLPENIFSRMELHTFTTMLERNVNIVQTSSAGRLFDAASSLLNLSQQNRFEGESAMALQFAAQTSTDNTVIELPQIKQGDYIVIDWRPLLLRMTEGRRHNEPVNKLAMLFHLTLVKAIVDYVATIPGYPVVLTGGCFQNRLLLQLTIEALQQREIKVYWPQQIPANDGGIAFGQAAIGVNQDINFQE